MSKHKCELYNRYSLKDGAAVPFDPSTNSAMNPDYKEPITDAELIRYNFMESAYKKLPFCKKMLDRIRGRK